MICAVQEAGTGGTFWAGWIVLARVDVDDSVGHLSSGFEGGLGSSKISGDGDVTGDGDFSAIVAYEATRQEKKRMFLCFCEMSWCLKWEMFIGFFFQQKHFQTITSVLTPRSKQITIVCGEGHFKQNSSSTITKKISTITKLSTRTLTGKKKSGFAKVWLHLPFQKLSSVFSSSSFMKPDYLICMRYPRVCVTLSKTKQVQKRLCIAILAFLFFPFQPHASLVSQSHFSPHWFNKYLSSVTRKVYFYPRTGFYLRTCEDGAGWHLIPSRISPRSEFFSQAYKNWHITWGINLGLDWPPLARGSKFHTIHTPTRSLSFLS